LRGLLQNAGRTIAAVATLVVFNVPGARVGPGSTNFFDCAVIVAVQEGSAYLILVKESVSNAQFDCTIGENEDAVAHWNYYRNLARGLQLCP